MKNKHFFSAATALFLFGIAATYIIVSCQKTESFDLYSWSRQNNVEYMKSKFIVSNRSQTINKIVNNYTILIPSQNGEDVVNNTFFVLTDAPIDIPKEKEIEIAYSNSNFLIKIDHQMYMVEGDTATTLRSKILCKDLKVFETGFSVCTGSSEKRMTISKIFSPVITDTTNIKSDVQLRMVGCDFLSGYTECGGGGGYCSSGGEGALSCSIQASSPCFMSCTASTSCQSPYYACCNVVQLPTYDWDPIKQKYVIGMTYTAHAKCVKGRG
jgi:hypothetical protein